MLDLLLTTEPAATLFKITLLLAIALIGHRALKPASAAVRHVWSMLALVSLVAVPLLSLALPAWNVSLPAGSPESELIANAPLSISHSSQPARFGELSSNSLVSERTAVSPPPITDPSTASSTLPQTRSIAEKSPMSPSQMALWIWVSVASLLLLRLAAGAVRVLSWVTHSTPSSDNRLNGILRDTAEHLDCRQPTLRLSERSRVPLLWGYFRPILLLPKQAEQWTTQRQRIVVTHELAHLERGDWLTLLLGRVAVALYWFHPLAWYLESQARRDCEEACDDRVLTAGTRASDYATHLLDLAQGLNDRVAPAPAVALIRPSQVEQRLRSILHPTRTRKSATRRFIGFAACLFVLILVPLASVRLEAWDPSSNGNPVLLGGSTPIELDLPTESDLTESHTGKILGHLAQHFASPNGPSGWTERYSLTDSEPSDGEEWFEVAYEHHNREQWEDAVKAFQEAAEAGYRPGTSAYNAACGLARLGEIDDAFDWLNRSFSEGFESYDLLYEDADLDSLRADPRYRAILENRDQSDGHWGHSKRAGDRLEQTETLYGKLTESDSANSDSWHEVGSDLLSLGQFDRAAQALERAIELDPENSSTSRYNLACTYSRAGQGDRALDALDAAVEAGFDSEERFENDRDLDFIRGIARFEAIAAKHDVLSLDQFRQGHDGSWFGWNESDISAKRWNPAVEQYRPFVDRNPNSGRGWFNLGYSLHYSGQHRESIDAFNRALDLEFRPSLQMYNIACAYARLDNADQAIRWLERAGEAGMSIASSMDDDDDFDSIRSDARFKDLEERYWLEEKRRNLNQHKKHIEEMLRTLGESTGLLESSSLDEAKMKDLKKRLDQELYNRRDSRKASQQKLYAEVERHQAEELKRRIQFQVQSQGQVDRSRATAHKLEAEVLRQQARQLERQTKLEAMIQAELADENQAQATEVAQLQAELVQRQAELARRKAELEAYTEQLKNQAQELRAREANQE